MTGLRQSSFDKLLMANVSKKLGFRSPNSSTPTSFEFDNYGECTLVEINLSLTLMNSSNFYLETLYLEAIGLNCWPIDSQSKEHA